MGSDFNIKWSLKKAKESLDTLEKEIGHLQSLTLDSIGKIMKLEPIIHLNKVQRIESFLRKRYSYLYSSLSIEQLEDSKQKYLQLLEEAFKQDEKIHESNLVIIENNKQIIDKVKKLMEYIGIPETYTEYTYPSNRHKNKKNVTQTSGWHSDLARVCPIGDTFFRCKETYKSLVNSANDYFNERIKELKDKELEKEKKKQIELRELAKYQVKYELPYESNWDDVMDSIISKNKYLHLSYNLMCNRNDWSDGPEFAKTGLEEFKIENEIDQKINDNIINAIVNWDGDGRVFRDCEYNYSVLIDFVEDKNLLEDYNYVLGKID